MPDGVNRADHRPRYPEKEVAVVRLHYDFLLWLLPHVAGFSRQHRFTLGDRIEALGIEVLEALVEAGYSRDKTAMLARANLRLETLRYLLRLSKDLKLLTVRQYGHAVETLAEVGKQVGGWQKQQEGKAVRHAPP